MKYWGIIFCFGTLWGCQPKSPSPHNIIQPQFAKLFFFSTQSGDTTLHIIQGSDTLAIAKKKRAPVSLIEYYSGGVL
jgi:hypothetical protein